MENSITATASLKNFRGSARKARLILDMIRGKNVSKAKSILQFSTKRMAKDIHKLLNSAVSNHIQSVGKIDEKNLIVEKTWADDAPIMKRHLPRAQGRATVIRKRSCHINISLSTNETKVNE